MQICNQCHKEVADGMYECPYCGSRALSGFAGDVKSRPVKNKENITECDNENITESDKSEPFADAETGEWEQTGVDSGGIPQYHVNDSAGQNKEEINIALLILSICFPIVGFVVFFVDKKPKPRTAKACGIAALVTFIVSLAIQMLVG